MIKDIATRAKKVGNPYFLSVLSGDVSVYKTNIFSKASVCHYIGFTTYSPTR